MVERRRQDATSEESKGTSYHHTHKKPIFENRICTNAGITCKLAFKSSGGNQRSVLPRIAPVKNHKHTEMHHCAKGFSHPKYVAANQNWSKSSKNKKECLQLLGWLVAWLADNWRMVVGGQVVGGWFRG